MTPDLLSCVLKLKNPRPVSMPYDQGRALAAQFLAWVQALDPQLSEALHHPDHVPRPYTVSNLNNLPKPSRGMVYLPSGSETWFRITSISPGLTEFLVEQLLPSLPEQLVISESQFSIQGAAWSPGEHDWAGVSTYQELINHDLNQRIYPKIRLQFASPTAFHKYGQHLPLVLPHLAIPSWFKSWNAFAPVIFPGDILNDIERSAAISYYKMQTAPVRYGKATIVGGLGTSTFNLLNTDPYFRYLVHVLSAFAFYCGTGVKTVLGMGQTRRIGDAYYRGVVNEKFGSE